MTWQPKQPTTAAGQDTDAFVAKLDGGNGTRLWGWQGGSVGNDYANAVAVDPTGDVYACGAAPHGMFDDDESAATTTSPQQQGEEEAGHAGDLWSSHEERSVSSAWNGGQRGGAVADMFVAKVGFV